MVEIASPGDETWEKSAFYHGIGVEELVVVDPLAHRVDWFRRGDTSFEATPASSLLDLTPEALAAQLEWPD